MIPEHHVVVIMSGGKQLLEDECLTEGIDGLHLIRITRVIDGNRHNLAAAPPCSPLDRVLQLGRSTQCLLLERSALLLL